MEGALVLLFKKNVNKFIFIWLKGKITIDLHQKYKNILAMVWCPIEEQSSVL